MGLIPPTPEAAAASVNYKAGGPMEAFYQLSAKQAMLRPVTPGYPVAGDNQIDVMTKGGPLDSTQTLVFQAVDRGYEKQDIGTGSAISVILFLLVLSISLIQRWLTREKT